MAVLEKLMHVLFLGIYVFVSYSFISNAEKNAKSSNPNVKVIGELTYRFLTNWTYGIQLIYYAFMVLAHLLSLLPFLYKVSCKLQSFADLLFTTLVIPYGLVVTIAFWSWYSVDRELVYPSWLDKVIPFWMNHALHTFNSVLPLIDMVFCNHKFHPWSLSSICILMYSLAYGICFFGTYYERGLWLYPMFEKFNFQQIALYSVGNIVAAFLLHAIARFICKLIWGLPTTAQPKKKKNKQKAKKVA